MTIRPGNQESQRAAAMHDWHKSLLHHVVPSLLRKWEERLGVKDERYFLQKMRTKWGQLQPRG